MTDRDAMVAALAERIAMVDGGGIERDLGGPVELADGTSVSVLDYPDEWFTTPREFAAAILGERGEFYPDGAGDGLHPSVGLHRLCDCDDLTLPCTWVATPAAPSDSLERTLDSVVRENETWAERCRELNAENAALRGAIADIASAVRDASRAAAAPRSET